ncbi:palmitoyltransferase ZDHHC16-like isoform X2 [Uloborus diversus]|uniref:palmitoyltransferase ZDHHC16-like isoform X2 n=1 Tax=Uloborus diversus TaxID=327109 RepID=UPI0024094595|nr:palmitoyltransferase ZDHHC16-like isoform X2 [Uloborus diversus]
MPPLTWKIPSCIKYLFDKVYFKYFLLKICLISLFYNDFADRYYVGDTCMEPMFWFVDHFTKILGPICVAAVIILTSSIIIIAYAVGLPFYLKQDTYILTLALVVGHWILLNVVFYYYMAFVTGPGFPPQGAMITEAVSICKRCIAPKPPRTHHCIVCNRCILKMDHHCPWLNNCVGHFNHRYFFMFGAYSWIGIVFIMIFGAPIAYEHFFGNFEIGFSPLLVNFVKELAKKIIFKTHLLQLDQTHAHNISTNATDLNSKFPQTLYHSCIVYAALLAIAVFFVLGGLLAWHARLISNGETSIESHINKKERERYSKAGLVYRNPYNFGAMKNWKIFLSIPYHRSWWRIILPYCDEPYGDGVQWNFLSELDYVGNGKEISKTCFVKIS